MTAPWAPGDIARLRSGGPALTVDTVREDGFLVCWWFRNDGELHRDTFTPHALQRIATADQEATWLDEVAR